MVQFTMEIPVGKVCTSVFSMYKRNISSPALASSLKVIDVFKQCTYRDGLKGGLVLLSNSQAGPSRNFLLPRPHPLAQLYTYFDHSETA